LRFCFWGIVFHIGVFRPAFAPVFLSPMKQLRLYRSILREEGWAALVKKTGKPAAIGLFLFFLLKGIGWLVLAYGGFELLF